MRRALALLAALLVLPSLARADGVGARVDDTIRRANLDTTYGRLDGDLGVAFGAGATFGPSAPRGALDLRLRYLDTAGIYGLYEDVLSATTSEPRRIVGTGVELRPLFLSRWLVGREWSLSWVDLLVDSLGLELGMFFEEPVGQGFESRPGLQASLGLEVPLLPRASGPWIGVHGGARWSDEALGNSLVSGSTQRTAFLSLTLAYHQILGVHLVDLRDRAPR